MTYISWSSDFVLSHENYLMYEQNDPTFDLKIKWVIVTHISWSSDLEDYLIYEHHTLGLWVSMTPRLTSK